MSAAANTEHSPDVNGDWDRGQAIKRRRLRAEIHSLREFSEATGVSRNAITAAEDGHGSKGTYQRLEAWLDRHEEETGDDHPEPEPRVETIEFVVEGDFGVKVTVRGPITNREDLQAAAAEIIRSIRAGREEG